MSERVAIRVLGALRPVCATTGAPMVGPLSVTARVIEPVVPNPSEVRFIRNRRGLLVFEHVPRLESHEIAEGALPALPGIGSLKVKVSLADPSGQYLARTVTVALPRDPDPAHAMSAASLFTPLDVELYPSPIGSIDPGWAAVRVSVKRQGTTTGLPNAYVRIRRAGAAGALLARGFADSRGEALVPVAGLPVVNWESNPNASVLANAIDAVLEAFFDSSQLDSPPDPQVIEDHIATLPKGTADLRLASGRELPTTIEVAVP